MEPDRRSVPGHEGHTDDAGQRRALSLLDAGVEIDDPSTTRIGGEVVVESGARLRPFTILEGRTVIRKGASVGPFVRLVDVEVGAEAEILDHCLLRECLVDEKAIVGPFTHVRPHSRIGAGARVGNFVELKKAHLGAGSSAAHLAYLGDVSVGPRANIGAGTITCNYDGVNKHRTTIGDGVFIGSGVNFVAPVVIGKGATIGAGSTITKPVAEDQLVLERSKQMTVRGWKRPVKKGAD